MAEKFARNQPPIHRYADGTPFRLPKQANPKRQAPSPPVRKFHQCNSGTDTAAVVDARDWKSQVAVVDLSDPSLDCQTLVLRLKRELKIRNYRRNTVKSYISAIQGFLNWAGIHFTKLTRDHVREYLEFLVDGGVKGTTLSSQLTAIRTCFDKFCYGDLTSGIATPRRAKKLPVVLSQNEVVRLLEAAVSFRDKLLLGLMYATGMRVSEVVRVKFKDIDFDRNLINIWQGKHSVDRQVVLPQSYRRLLKSLSQAAGASPFLFPSEANLERSDRFLSPRTVQRVMARTVQLAGILKQATPHSLRHSFATHCFEDGCDVRRIQKVLGHANLETTTIYIHVAKPSDCSALPSPIDRLNIGDENTPPAAIAIESNVPKNQVGRFKIQLQKGASSEETLVAVEIFVGSSRDSRVSLLGIVVRQQRPGFWTFSFPPLEYWKSSLARLPKVICDRIEQPRFYENVRDAIVGRLRSEKCQPHLAINNGILARSKSVSTGDRQKTSEYSPRSDTMQRNESL